MNYNKGLLGSLQCIYGSYPVFSFNSGLSHGLRIKHRFVLLMISIKVVVVAALFRYEQTKKFLMKLGFC